jgi:phasin family protein
MANNAVEFTKRAEDATRTIYNAAQELLGVQYNTAQRLAEVQQGVLNHTIEAANDQLQVIGRVRNPREFASAQAELVKTYGQRCVDSLKRTVDIVAEGWQEYGDRLEKGVNAATDKVQRTASTRKSA